MIVIGSRAARHHGILPPWRNGASISGDIDVLATAKECERLVARASVVRRAAPHPMLIIGGDLYDVRTVGQGFYDLARQLSGGLYASPGVLWASLYLTAGLSPGAHEKSLKDFYFYDSLPIERSADHIRLALMFRDASLAGIKHRYLEQGE